MKQVAEEAAKVKSLCGRVKCTLRSALRSKDASVGGRCEELRRNSTPTYYQRSRSRAFDFAECRSNVTK